MTPTAPETDLGMYFRLSQFLYREAALLDARNWDAWGQLFTADGIYWVPATRDQKDALDHVSLINDDSLLRDLRLRRLKNGDAASLQAPPASSHLVSNIVIAEVSEAQDRYTLHSRFVIAQHAPWGTKTFHGDYVHELVRGTDGNLRIALKRVNLVDVDGPLGDVLTIL